MTGFPVPRSEAVPGHTYSELDLKRAVSDWLVRWSYAPLLEVTHPPVLQGGRAVARRIDVLGVKVSNTEAGGGHNVDVLAVEVKRTRDDYAADVRNPDKRAPWMGLGAHYYAVPGGLRDLTPPSGCGQLSITRRLHPIGKEYDHVEVTHLPARSHVPVAPPGWLLECVAWRVALLTARINGWPVEDVHPVVDHTFGGEHEHHDHRA